MSQEVTPDSPTRCSVTGEDMVWGGQGWVHYEPHDWCILHDVRNPGDYTIAELQARSHQQSKDKGFHDYQPTDLREVASLNAERVALFHSEASEMLEEQRKGHAPDYTYYSKTTKEFDYNTTRLVKETIEYFEEQQYWDDGTPYLKPEGQGAEAADMIIRILDWAGANNVDMQKHLINKLDYNATRAKMHGGKAF